MTHVYYYPGVESYIVLLINLLPEVDEFLLSYWSSGWLTSGSEIAAIGEIETLIESSLNH